MRRMSDHQGAGGLPNGLLRVRRRKRYDGAIYYMRLKITWGKEMLIANVSWNENALNLSFVGQKQLPRS